MVRRLTCYRVNQLSTRIAQKIGRLRRCQSLCCLLLLTPVGSSVLLGHDPPRPSTPTSQSSPGPRRSPHGETPRLALSSLRPRPAAPSTRAKSPGSPPSSASGGAVLRACQCNATPLCVKAKVYAFQQKRRGCGRPPPEPSGLFCLQAALTRRSVALGPWA